MTKYLVRTIVLTIVVLLFYHALIGRDVSVGAAATVLGISVVVDLTFFVLIRWLWSHKK